MNKFDIIIVGSGLGGLECANILSKEGYNICVLEKNAIFGGVLQTFTRKGRKLDTGIHYIGSLDEGQIMHQYFKYFGIIDKLNMIRLDNGSFDQIYFQGETFHHAMGHDNFVETLARDFPQEKENLKRYVGLLKQAGNLISVDRLREGLIAQSGLDYFHQSAYQNICNITSNRKLQNILAATSMLYGGLKDSSTWYHHATINNSYIESSYRFSDGTMQIANLLIQQIRANGGTVLNNKEITRFVIDECQNKVIAVETSKGERFEAKHFISNIHPSRTLDMLDKTRAIKKAYISRIKSRPNTFGIFTTYLLLKKDKIRYQNKNFYVHGTNDVWYDIKNTRDKVNYALICYQHNKGSDFSDVILLLTPMNTGELKEWENTRFENRGQSYLDFKEEYSQKMIEFISQRGFDYTADIEHVYTTTPLSYRDYLNSVDGSAYGIIKDYKCPELSFVLPRTKISNLFLTGQNLNIHGALGVTLTAMFTCAELLGHEYLAKKVGNA